MHTSGVRRDVYATLEPDSGKVQLLTVGRGKPRIRYGL